MTLALQELGYTKDVEGVTAIDPVRPLLLVGFGLALAIGIIGTLILAITRKKRFLTKWVVGAGLVVLLLGIGNWYWSQRYEISVTVTQLRRKYFPEVPTAIKNKADQFASARVGANDFKKYFGYLPEFSYKNNETNSYWLYYDFIPLREYGEKLTYKIEVSNTGVVFGGDVMPDCTYDKGLCQFNLTKDEWRKMKIDYNVQGVSKVEPPFMFFYTCPYKEYRVDYFTKKIEVEEDHGGLILSDPCTSPWQ